MLGLQERQQKDAKTAESGSLHQAFLFSALARVYGRRYLLLGLLKLGSDVLTFAGADLHLSFDLQGCLVRFSN